MPLLQVRDFPEEYYQMLSTLAQKQNRSISQQTVYMIKTQLDADFSINKTKRNSALTTLKNLSVNVNQTTPDAVDLIREDRESDHYHGDVL